MTAPDAAAEQPQSGLLARLLKLAAPVAGTNLLIMLMGLVDTIVVGRHSASELAELALAWSLNGTSMVACIGFLVGVQVLAARRMGEGRAEGVGAIWRRGLWTALLLGTIFGLLLHFGALWTLEHLGQSAELARGAASCAAILGLSLVPVSIYLTCAKTLEAVNRPRAALVLNAGANVVNLGLVLWLVPLYGADGAAWGTFGSRVFMAIGAVAWILLMPDNAQFKLLDLASPSAPGELNEQMSIGFAAAGSRILEAGSFNALTIIAGIAGGIQIAAFSIVLNVMSFGFMPALGLATATAVVASNARGADDFPTALRVSWIGTGVSALYGVVFSLIMLALSATIANGFSTDPVLVAYAATLLALLWLMAVPDFIQVVVAEALRALGRPWFATWSHMLSYVFVMVPLGWLFCLHLDRGARGLVEAVGVASLVSASVLLVRLSMIKKLVSGHSD
jgi:multidrug resistance protein, MATE family